MQRDRKGSRPPMKLNLGAGEPFSHARARAYPDWIDIDVRPSTRPTVAADVRRLPFATGSASHVYAGHVLEHLDLDDVPVAIREVRRVLRSRGEVLFVGPDVMVAERMHRDGLISDERLASDKAHGEPGNVCVHQWDSDPVVVFHALIDARFVFIRPIPIPATPLDFPVFDRGSLDQFAILATRP
jgi:hypothetical protein